MTARTLMAALLLATGCATAERPASLAALDSVRNSPSVRDSEQLAPQAHADADQCAERAAEALQNGDRPAAEHWAAMAEAAYEQAIALSRRARAEETAANTARSVDGLRHELLELEAEQAKLDAETSALELQVKVIRDAQPLTPVEPASPARQQARRAAARAWLTEAKLLCVSETLVVGERSTKTGELIAEIAQGLEGVYKGDAGKLVEEARRLRSACLERLTLARRPATREAPHAALADTLLSSLSEVDGLHPFRDDRGIVVILSAPASSTGLTSTTQTKLREVATVATSAPEFRLLVVWHAAGGAGESKTDAALLDQALSILDPGGARRAARELVGQEQPLVDPATPGARERNFRMEIVFITPTSS